MRVVYLQNFTKIHDLVCHEVLKYILVWCRVERVEEHSSVLVHCGALKRTACPINQKVLTTSSSVGCCSLTRHLAGF